MVLPHGIPKKGLSEISENTRRSRCTRSFVDYAKFLSFPPLLSASCTDKQNCVSDHGSHHPHSWSSSVVFTHLLNFPRDVSYVQTAASKTRNIQAVLHHMEVLNRHVSGSTTHQEPSLNVLIPTGYFLASNTWKSTWKWHSCVYIKDINYRSISVHCVNTSTSTPENS